MQNMFGYVLFCVCWFVYWFFNRKNGKIPPAFHGALPLIGHAHLLLAANGTDLWRLVEKLGIHCLEKGGVTHLRLGSQFFYVISDPDDYITVANTCLEKNFIFKKFLNSWIGEGLVSAPVPVWKRTSKLLFPAFTKHVFHEYIGIYNSQATSLVNNLARFSGKGPFDPKVYVRETALKGNVLTTFGLPLNEDTSRRLTDYMKAVDELLEVVTRRLLNLWMHSDSLYAFTPTKKREDELLKTIHDFSYSIMTQKKEAMNSAGKISNMKKGTAKSKGFLDLMLQLLTEGALNEQEILDQVNTILFAGYHTTSTTLVLMLVIIGSYPEVQSRIYKELQDTLWETDRDISTDDLTKLVYLEATIKEVCRLYTAFPIILRYVDKDVKLKNYTMKAGSNCALLLQTLNKHKIWGPDSEEFRPDRWLKGAVPPTPDIYTGFGAGRRACAGRPASIFSLKISLAHLLRSYKITADHTKLRMELHMISEPMEGYHISIESRH